MNALRAVVKVFSGGEKARLAYRYIVGRNPLSFSALDEPTTPRFS